jgi:hypothetical protein
VGVLAGVCVCVFGCISKWDLERLRSKASLRKRVFASVSLQFTETLSSRARARERASERERDEERGKEREEGREREREREAHGTATVEKDVGDEQNWDEDPEHK